MKEVTMFIMASCPHCRRALSWMDQLKAEHPEYGTVQVQCIDENVHPDIASTFDYYYVPTYYIDGEKVHEGVPSLEIVETVFKKALE